MAAKSNDENKPESNVFQISAYICEIHDLVTRVDERVKTIFKLQNETDKKLEKLRDNHVVSMGKINSIQNYDLPNVDKKIDNVRKDLNSFEKEFNSLLEKLQNYEFEAKDLKNFKKSAEEKVKFFFDLVFKLIMSLAIAYIIYHLGWNK